MNFRCRNYKDDPDDMNSILFSQEYLNSGRRVIWIDWVGGWVISYSGRKNTSIGNQKKWYPLYSMNDLSHYSSLLHLYKKFMRAENSSCAKLLAPQFYCIYTVYYIYQFYHIAFTTSSLARSPTKIWIYKQQEQQANSAHANQFLTATISVAFPEISPIFSLSQLEFDAVPTNRVSLSNSSWAAFATSWL